MFELFFVSYLYSKKTKNKIYKHQMLAIYFNLSLLTFKISVIIISFFSKKEYFLYTKNPVLIPIGISIYLVLIFIRSFVNLKIKWLIDDKYFPSNKILMVYGFIGSLISLLIIIISSLINHYNSNILMEDFDDLISKINNNTKNNSTIYYFDNAIDFNWYNLKILPEIPVVLLGIILFFFYKYFYILIIKNLSPVHIVIAYPIYVIIKKLIFPIYTFCIDKNFFVKGYDSDMEKIYIIDLIGDIISLFAVLIYFEIIEINCCGLSFYTKKNKRIRGDNELDKIKKKDNNNMEEEEKKNVKSGLIINRNDSFVPNQKKEDDDS